MQANFSGFPTCCRRSAKLLKITVDIWTMATVRLPAAEAGVLASFRGNRFDSMGGMVIAESEEELEDVAPGYPC